MLNHLDGMLNYCRTKVPIGVVEAVNGNIKTLLHGGPGYRMRIPAMAITDSNLMAITIPGSWRSVSERSDAGQFHDRELIASVNRNLQAGMGVQREGAGV